MYGTTGLSYELGTSGGAKTIAIVPATTVQSGTFTFSGVESRVNGMRNYLRRITLHLLTTFDPDAAGSAVSWDKLYKGLTSVEVITQLGVMFPHAHTSGALLGHFIQVLGLGYAYPQGARTQIPASTDTDVTIDLFYAIPFAQDLLVDPMETAVWTGFMDGGTIEAKVGITTVYDGDYAGAVIKAPTTLRCLAHTMPSPRNFIGFPNQWRNRQITGGGTSPKLTNVGGETQLNGVAAGCGLAAMYWLSDATGIGLGGPDGVDNFTAFGFAARGQKTTQNLDPLFWEQRELLERRFGPFAGTGTTIMNDNASWPATMDSGTAGDNRPSANAQQMALPIVAPARKLHTSKVQRVYGDLTLDFQVTSAITNPHQIATWELMEHTQNQVLALAASGGFRGTGVKKSAGGKQGTDSELRYAAYEFGAE